MGDARPSGPISEKEMRSFVEAYLVRLKSADDPAFDSFAEFMPSLPLEQQFAVVRFCVHQNVAPKDPIWIIFALAQQVWVKASAAVTASVEPLRAEARNVEQKAIDLFEKALETRKDALDDLKRSPAQRKQDLEEIRADVRAALMSEHRLISDEASALRVSARLWTGWAVVTLVLVLVTFWFTQSMTYDRAYAAGYYRRDAQVPHEKREMLNHLEDDPRLRTSPAWRKIIQDRIGTL